MKRFCPQITLLLFVWTFAFHQTATTKTTKTTTLKTRETIKTTTTKDLITDYNGQQREDDVHLIDEDKDDEGAQETNISDLLQQKKNEDVIISSNKKEKNKTNGTDDELTRTTRTDKLTMTITTKSKINDNNKNLNLTSTLNEEKIPNSKTFKNKQQQANIAQAINKFNNKSNSNLQVLNIRDFIRQQQTKQNNSDDNITKLIKENSSKLNTNNNLNESTNNGKLEIGNKNKNSPLQLNTMIKITMNGLRNNTHFIDNNYSYNYNYNKEKMNVTENDNSNNKSEMNKEKPKIITKEFFEKTKNGQQNLSAKMLKEGVNVTSPMTKFEDGLKRNSAASGIGSYVKQKPFVVSGSFKIGKIIETENHKDLSENSYNQSSKSIEARSDDAKNGKKDVLKAKEEENDNKSTPKLKLEESLLIDASTTTNPDAKEIENAVQYGLGQMRELYLVKEPLLYRMGLYLDKDDPATRVAAFGAPNEKALHITRFGYAALQARIKLGERYSLLGRQNSGSVLNPTLRAEGFQAQCPIKGSPRCPPLTKRYRTADGTCNNRLNPWFGGSMLPMSRFLPPSYDDGIQSVRRSVTGLPLPSAREISVVIHRDKDIEMPSVTLMFMQWGQFLDHDIISTVQARAFNNSIPRCCTRGGRDILPEEFLHPECLPIKVSKNDWFYSRFGVQCMEFLRSAPTSRIDCDLGWREQINQVTSFIDASMVYGSDHLKADSLRSFRRGMLRYGRATTRGPLLPPDPPGGELCRAGALTTSCFRAGDGRFGVQPGLTAFHTIFVRYHNFLASRLSQLNDHWSDEKIYQETRRIIGALIQHITYREFLPLVLGQEVMDLFELTLQRKGYYQGYDERINPSPANAFSSAAFRFGHSLVQKSFVRTDEFHRTIKNNVTIHEEQENVENIWSEGSIDRLLLGFANQASQRRDEFITEELTNHLFQTSSSPFGLDLAAINIQRGRDHGIPSYTSWREPCGLSPIRSFSDLPRVMSEETSRRLRAIYESVEDIDLYTGGLAEKPVRGGTVGPTFACIIAQQFSNLRKGDRFWYENGNFESSFTPAQLQQIRRVTFAQVICNSMTEVETLQPFVFLSSDEFKNKRINCQDPILDSLSLSPWAEVAKFGPQLFPEEEEEDIRRPILEPQVPIQLQHKIGGLLTTFNTNRPNFGGLNQNHNFGGNLGNPSSPFSSSSLPSLFRPGPPNSLNTNSLLLNFPSGIDDKLEFKTLTEEEEADDEIKEIKDKNQNTVLNGTATTKNLTVNIKKDEKHKQKYQEVKLNLKNYHLNNKNSTEKIVKKEVEEKEKSDVRIKIRNNEEENVKNNITNIKQASNDKTLRRVKREDTKNTETNYNKDEKNAKIMTDNNFDDDAIINDNLDLIVQVGEEEESGKIQEEEEELEVELPRPLFNANFDFFDANFKNNKLTNKKDKNNNNNNVDVKRNKVSSSSSSSPSSSNQVKLPAKVVAVKIDDKLDFGEKGTVDEEIEIIHKKAQNENVNNNNRNKNNNKNKNKGGGGGITTSTSFLINNNNANNKKKRPVMINIDDKLDVDAFTKGGEEEDDDNKAKIKKTKTKTKIDNKFALRSGDLTNIKLNDKNLTVEENDVIIIFGNKTKTIEQVNDVEKTNKHDAKSDVQKQDEISDLTENLDDFRTTNIKLNDKNSSVEKDDVIIIFGNKTETIERVNDVEKTNKHDVKSDVQKQDKISDLTENLDDFRTTNIKLNNKNSTVEKDDVIIIFGNKTKTIGQVNDVEKTNKHDVKSGVQKQDEISDLIENLDDFRTTNIKLNDKNSTVEKDDVIIIFGNKTKTIEQVNDVEKTNRHDVKSDVQKQDEISDINLNIKHDTKFDFDKLHETDVERRKNGRQMNYERLKLKLNNNVRVTYNNLWYQPKTDEYKKELKRNDVNDPTKQHFVINYGQMTNNDLIKNDADKDKDVNDGLEIKFNYAIPLIEKMDKKTKNLNNDGQNYYYNNNNSKNKTINGHKRRVNEIMTDSILTHQKFDNNNDDDKKVNYIFLKPITLRSHKRDKFLNLTNNKLTNHDINTTKHYNDNNNNNSKDLIHLRNNEIKRTKTKLETDDFHGQLNSDHNEEKTLTLTVTDDKLKQQDKDDGRRLNINYKFTNAKDEDFNDKNYGYNNYFSDKNYVKINKEINNIHTSDVAMKIDNIPNSNDKFDNLDDVKQNVTFTKKNDGRDAAMKIDSIHNTNDKLDSFGGVKQNIAMKIDHIHNTNDKFDSSGDVKQNVAMKIVNIHSTNDKFDSSSNVKQNVAMKIDNIHSTNDKFDSSGNVKQNVAMKIDNIHSTNDKFDSSSDVKQNIAMKIDSIHNTNDKFDSSGDVKQNVAMKIDNIHSTNDKFDNSSNVKQNVAIKIDSFHRTNNKFDSFGDVKQNVAMKIHSIHSTNNKFDSSGDVKQNVALTNKNDGLDVLDDDKNDALIKYVEVRKVPIDEFWTPVSSTTFRKDAVRNQNFRHLQRIEFNQRLRLKRDVKDNGTNQDENNAKSTTTKKPDQDLEIKAESRISDSVNDNDDDDDYDVDKENDDQRSSTNQGRTRPSSKKRRKTKTTQRPRITTTSTTLRPRIPSTSTVRPKIRATTTKRTTTKQNLSIVHKSKPNDMIKIKLTNVTKATINLSNRYTQEDQDQNENEYSGYYFANNNNNNYRPYGNTHTQENDEDVVVIHPSTYTSSTTEYDRDVVVITSPSPPSYYNHYGSGSTLGDRNKDVTYLFGAVNNNNRVNTKTKTKTTTNAPDYHVNINIQYNLPTTQKPRRKLTTTKYHYQNTEDLYHYDTPKPLLVARPQSNQVYVENITPKPIYLIKPVEGTTSSSSYTKKQYQIKPNFGDHFQGGIPNPYLVQEVGNQNQNYNYNNNNKKPTHQNDGYYFNNNNNQGFSTNKPGSSYIYKPNEGTYVPMYQKVSTIEPNYNRRRTTTRTTTRKPYPNYLYTDYQQENNNQHEFFDNEYFGSSSSEVEQLTKRPNFNSYNSYNNNGNNYGTNNNNEDHGIIYSTGVSTVVQNNDDNYGLSGSTRPNLNGNKKPNTGNFNFNSVSTFGTNLNGNKKPNTGNFNFNSVNTFGSFPSSLHPPSTVLGGGSTGNTVNKFPPPILRPNPAGDFDDEDFNDNPYNQQFENLHQHQHQHQRPNKPEKVFYVGNKKIKLPISHTNNHHHRDSSSSSASSSSSFGSSEVDDRLDLDLSRFNKKRKGGGQNKGISVDQGDKNFVKISSIQGDKYLQADEKFTHIYAQQKEGDGDLELELEPFKVDIHEAQRKGEAEEKLIDLLQVDVIPSEIRVDKWLLYEEIKDANYSGIEMPSLMDQNVGWNVSSTTNELPKPMHLEIADKNEKDDNKNKTRQDEQKDT